MDLAERTQVLIDQIQEIETVMKDNLEQLEWSHQAAVQLRAEHTRLQAALRAYLNGDITAEEATAVLDSMTWN